MKNLNIYSNCFKKILIFLLIFLSFSNISTYSSIFSSINIENTSANTDYRKNNVDEEKKIVYLTFDDGPSKNTELILDILKENNAEVIRFARFEKGEGIEKKEENFAEEVAKQLQ